MFKESITLSMELAVTSSNVLRIIIHWLSTRRNVGLTQGSFNTKGTWPFQSFKTQHPPTQTWLELSLQLQISYGFRQLVNTELENRPSSHLTKHSSPARGIKLSSSKDLAWNLYTVWQKVLENTKRANSSSFSTYFMISVTDANLHADSC